MYIDGFILLALYLLCCTSLIISVYTLNVVHSFDNRLTEYRKKIKNVFNQYSVKSKTNSKEKRLWN